MHALSRYLRLWFALGASASSASWVPGNFLVKITVEMLWFAIAHIWRPSRPDQPHRRLEQVGVHCSSSLLLRPGRLARTFFLSNCGEFSDMVRSGDSISAVQPIDEQFL